MSSVEPTRIGAEPQSIVAMNEKSAGFGSGLAAAGPASASATAAASTAMEIRRMSESFRFGLGLDIGARLSARHPPGRTLALVLLVELLDDLAVARAHAAVEADVHAVVARPTVDDDR